MTLLIILIISVLNILCFIVGARVGQKVNKGETIELPTINPLEIAKKHEYRKEVEAQQNKIATIMQNIESYDGASYGQKDV